MEPEVNKAENSEPASIDDFEPSGDVELDKKIMKVPLPYIIKSREKTESMGKSQKTND